LLETLLEFGVGFAGVRRGFAASSLTETPLEFCFGVGFAAARRGFAASSCTETLLEFGFFVVCIARIVAQVWGAGSKMVIPRFADFKVMSKRCDLIVFDRDSSVTDSTAIIAGCDD